MAAWVPKASSLCRLLQMPAQLFLPRLQQASVEELLLLLLCYAAAALDGIGLRCWFGWGSMIYKGWDGCMCSSHQFGLGAVSARGHDCGVS